MTEHTTRRAASPRMAPPGYVEHTTTDLRGDRRAALTIQLTSVALAATVTGAALLGGVELSTGWSSWVTWLVTLGVAAVYMATHELVHAAAFWVFTRTAPTVSLRFPYLSVGGRGLLRRAPFLTVALAPVATLGPGLMLLLIAAPQDYRFTVFVVTVLNFAGSTGDYLQARTVAALPPEALIQDDGVTTTVWLPVA